MPPANAKGKQPEGSAGVKASGSGGGKSSSAAAKAGKQGKQDAAAVKGPKPKAFRVHLHILEVKDIETPTGSVPDLVATASVMNLAAKYTQVVKESKSCYFDAVLEWEFMATYEEMRDAKLTIKLLNSKTEAKKEMLGMYELKLSTIRKQPFGEYFMVWLALYTDPDECAR